MSVHISTDSHQSERTHILIAKVYLDLESKYYYACPKRDRLVGKDHRSSPTASHKEDNQKINHASTSSHNGSPYVHAIGITNFYISIFQIHNYSTSMTLILPSSYLKTIIKYQTSISIQCTLYERFYYIPLGACVVVL